MKYIATKDNAGNEEIFTFPRAVPHDAMAEVLAHIKDQTHGDWLRVFRKPVSAGFVGANGTCFGRSESLNLSSRPGDSVLLAQQYGQGC